MQTCFLSMLRPCSAPRSAQPSRSSCPAVPMAAVPRCSLRGCRRRCRRAAVRAQAAADDATSPDALAAVQQLDALIDTLMSKKNPQDLAQTVAENIMSFDQRFWLRLATRSDAASDEEQKQQLAALAKVGCWESRRWYWDRRHAAGCIMSGVDIIVRPLAVPGARHATSLLSACLPACRWSCSWWTAW